MWSWSFMENFGLVVGIMSDLGVIFDVWLWGFGWLVIGGVVVLVRGGGGVWCLVGV